MNLLRIPICPALAPSLGFTGAEAPGLTYPLCLKITPFLLARTLRRHTGQGPLMKRV